MATSETTNLQLVKYGAGTDNFIRTDYNGNLDKIDTFAGNTNQAIATLSDQIGTLRIKDITNATRTTASSTSSTTNIDQLYTVPADGWYRIVSRCSSNASSEAYAKAGAKQLIYAAVNQRVEIVVPLKQGTKIYLTAIYGGESFIEQFTM